MIRLFLVLVALAFATAALAQSPPNPQFYTGYIPTAGQWNALFASKQDYLGFPPLNKNGDVMAGPLNFSGAAPALTSCGTGPAISGNDQSGEVTMGTGSPTGCVITFASAKLSAPKCVVTWQANLASMGYTVSTTALTLTQTATSSNKVDYYCPVTQ